MIGLGGNASMGIGLSITLNDRFSRNATAITNNMLRMGQTAHQVKANMRAALGSLQTTGAVMAGIGYGTYKGVARTVEAYKDFEYIMRSIQAVAGTKNMPAEHLDKISKSAKELGIQYGVLPTQVGKAMFVLAKAGIVSEKQMGMMTKSVLQLSAAADEPADKMAHDLISVLNTFQLKAESAATVADMLSKSANLVQVDVQDLFESIKYSGNTARSLNVPLEQLLANLAFIGSKGLKGSMAGIALQNSLVELSRAVVNPKRNQVTAMAALGISPKEIAESTNGLKDLVGLGKLLAARTQGMNPLELNTRLEALAGRRGSRFLGPLIKDWQKLQELQGGVLQSGGSAQSVAMTRLDSLAGAQKRYNAAMEDFKIAAGGAFADFLKAATPLITKLVKGLTALISTKTGKFFLLATTGALLLVGAVGAILLPLATLGLLATNARGGFMALRTAAVWAMNSIGSSVTSATQRMRIFQAAQRASPTGWAQYPAGTMINGRNVGGQIFNANRSQGGAMAAGRRGGGLFGRMAGGTGVGLMRLANGAAILFSAFQVLTDFINGKMLSGIAGILGGIAGFLIGGPLGAAIGMGIGGFAGSLFESDKPTSAIENNRNRQFYLHGTNNVVAEPANQNSFGYGNSSNDYFKNAIYNQGQGGTVNVYVDGKKAVEKMMRDTDENVYVGGDIQ